MKTKTGAAESEFRSRVFVTRILLADRIAGMNSLSSSPPAGSGERWRFLRDVLVFQLKLLLDNLRDFALVPISLVAALIDLIYKGEREGTLFYRVLRWGAHSEEVIDVYSAIEHQGGNGSCDRSGTPRNEGQRRPRPRCRGTCGRQVAPEDRQIAQ